METGLNIGISFAAGLLSFLSPCILPLIPAYLSLMAGTSIQTLQESGTKRLGAFFNTVFFVLGFAVVFMVLGILFSTTFALLGGVSRIINIIAGVIVVVLGLNFIFNFWDFLSFEKRFQFSGKPTSRPASFLFGMAFGAGWSPCIGPILSSILFLAGTSGSLMRGIVLLSVYSLGLGLPFLLTGLFFPFALKQLGRIKQHLRTIKIASGAFLVFIGALILFGRLQKLNTVLFSAAYQLETWEQENPEVARYVFALVFLAFAASILVFYIRKILKERSAGGSFIEGTQGRPQPPAVPPGVETMAKPLGVRSYIMPLRLVFFALFLCGSVLSILGLLNFSQLLSSWFSFQGI